MNSNVNLDKVDICQLLIERARLTLNGNGFQGMLNTVEQIRKLKETINDIGLKMQKELGIQVQNISNSNVNPLDLDNAEFLKFWANLSVCSKTISSVFGNISIFSNNEGIHEKLLMKVRPFFEGSFKRISERLGIRPSSFEEFEEYEQMYSGYAHLCTFSPEIKKSDSIKEAKEFIWDAESFIRRKEFPQEATMIPSLWEMTPGAVEWAKKLTGTIFGNRRLAVELYLLSSEGKTAFFQRIKEKYLEGREENTSFIKTRYDLKPNVDLSVESVRELICFVKNKEARQEDIKMQDN